MNLYSPKRNTSNLESTTNSILLDNIKESITAKIKKPFSLDKVFNPRSNSKNTKNKCPKITLPKWPFSKRQTEPESIKKDRIFSSKPSQKYHNFYTIKWLDQKYSDNVKERSIYSLLPNHGKPIIPEFESESSKRRRKIAEYLENLRNIYEKDKFVYSCYSCCAGCQCSCTERVGNILQRCRRL